MTAYCARVFTTVLCLVASTLVAVAQAPASKTKKPAAKTAARDGDPLAEARRMMGISLVTSLADEARSFRDLMLRARVQARSADALWELDQENARALFRRAWDSAEAADDENARKSEEERRSQALARGSTARRLQPSVRREVLLRVEFKGGGAMTNNFNVDSFDLAGLFTALAHEDLNRAVELPRSFTGESPRSVAVLAVARTILDKKRKTETR
ncbi:MAG: hypothetical protein ABR577_18610 [Pyrinomonadaceae bacterium]